MACSWIIAGTNEAEINGAVEQECGWYHKPTVQMWLVVGAINSYLMMQTDETKGEGVMEADDNGHQTTIQSKSCTVQMNVNKSWDRWSNSEIQSRDDRTGVDDCIKNFYLDANYQIQ